MTDSKEWCDGDWRWRSSSRPFAGAASGSPGRALEAGERGSPGRAVQAGIRGKRLNNCVRNRSVVGSQVCFNISQFVSKSNCVRLTASVPGNGSGCLPMSKCL